MVLPIMALVIHHFRIAKHFRYLPNGDCTNVPTNFRIPELNNVLDPAETEEFTYRSFNPSLGATWQAKENLNLFANLPKAHAPPV